MTGEEMIALTMKMRTEAGLKLTFNTDAEEITLGLPLRDEPFTCFPKDMEQRIAWIASGERKGWVLLS